MERDKVFSAVFPLQLCHFSTSNEPRFVRRSLQEKAARRKGCGWLGSRREAESAKGESVVHFNSRLLNPSLAFPRYHSVSFHPSFYILFRFAALREKFTKRVPASPSSSLALSPLPLSPAFSMQPDSPTFSYSFILIPGSRPVFHLLSQHLCNSCFS